MQLKLRRDGYLNSVHGDMVKRLSLSSHKASFQVRVLVSLQVVVFLLHCKGDCLDVKQTMIDLDGRGIKVHQTEVRSFCRNACLDLKPNITSIKVGPKGRNRILARIGRLV